MRTAPSADQAPKVLVSHWVFATMPFSCSVGAAFAPCWDSVLVTASMRIERASPLESLVLR